MARPVTLAKMPAHGLPHALKNATIPTLAHLLFSSALVSIFRQH
jgi:hypothetical protein